MESLPPELISFIQQLRPLFRAEVFNSFCYLTASLAYYDLTKENIALRHLAPTLAAQGFQALVGEGRSRGLELDIAGQINDYWRVIGSYTYTATEFTKAASGIQGNRFSDVPHACREPLDELRAHRANTYCTVSSAE